MTPGAISIAVLVGDASGDAQTAALIGRLRAGLPGLTVWGVGGRRLREAGAHLLYDTSRSSAIGVVQALKLIGPLLRIRRKVLAEVRANPPAFVLAVDFGAFNLRVTSQIRELGVPVAYWFPPGSWRRTPVSERIVQSADFFISPYPWYAENLRNQGARALFLGHPLIDQVQPRLTRAQFAERMGIDPDSRLIALLPGSRGHEVVHILPVLIEAAVNICRQDTSLSFVVPLSDHFPVRSAWKIAQDVCSRCGMTLAEARISLARGATSETLCHANAAAICSGSATLEALVAGVPMVVVYRGSTMMKFEYKLRRMNVKYMAMPNIIADSPVVPELRQDEVTPVAVAAHLSSLIDDGPERSAQVETLARLRQDLLPGGAIQKTAGALIEWLGERA